MPIRTPRARLSSAIRGHKKALRRREKEIRKPNVQTEDLVYSKRAKRMTVSKGVLENRITAAETEKSAIQRRLNNLYTAREKKEKAFLNAVERIPKTPVEDRKDAIYRSQLREIDTFIEKLEKKRDKLIAEIEEAWFVMGATPKPQKK